MDGLLQRFYKKYIWNTESRAVNLENPKVPLNGYTLDQILGANMTSGSGRSVSHSGLLTLSAVYRAVNIKAGFISATPFQVFEKTDNGRKLADHPSARLLSSKPNNKVSKVVFFDRAMQHFELLGNHFALINRNGIGRVERLDLLHPKDVKVLETKDRLYYKVEGMADLISSDDMIHVPNMGDGVNGKSVLQYMRDDAGLMLDIRAYGESFFGQGGKPAGLLLPKMPATPVQRQEAKESFKDAKKQGGDVAMPYGWEYKEVSVPPADAEWVTTNDFAISTIARWFGVPTQKLGDSKVKYSNVEFMGIEFLQDTMAPIACKFENEYTNKLFMLHSEERLYAEFNLDAYLRADSMSKAEAQAKRVQNALLTPNEGRALDNRPSIEGGDELFIQGATVPLSLQKQLYANKPSQTVRKIRKRVEQQVQDGMEPQLIIEGLFGNDGKGY